MAATSRSRPGLDGARPPYPPEAKDAIVDCELNHSPYQPEYWLKNINRISEGR